MFSCNEEVNYHHYFLSNFKKHSVFTVIFIIAANEEEFNVAFRQNRRAQRENRQFTETVCLNFAVKVYPIINIFRCLVQSKFV